MRELGLGRRLGGGGLFGWAWLMLIVLVVVVKVENEELKRLMFEDDGWGFKQGDC